MTGDQLSEDRTDSWPQLESERHDIVDELIKLENIHKEYQSAVHLANKLQQKLSEGVGKKLKRIPDFRGRVRKCETHTDIETDKKYDIDQEMEFWKNQLSKFRDSYPRMGDFYLRTILGPLNVNLIEKDARLKYKEEYERFKLILNLIIFLVSFITIFVNYKALDAALQFLLVWYHCTLTIRESILIANGSRIHGWWRALQFITTIQAGIIILWPDGPSYAEFRRQFLLYTVYTAFLQYLQFYYQHSCLYRLRALGERYDMDVTLQGFHSWMWKGLSFLLPPLYGGYIFQWYNAYKLYQLYQQPETHEWHVILISFIYFVIFLGNIVTTTLVVSQKFRQKLKAS